MSDANDDRVRDVGRQLQATINTIENMDAKAKNNPASAHFGNDFNRLLGLAKQVFPDVDANLWPSPVGEMKVGPQKFCEARHTEVLAYLRQIASRFPEEDDGRGVVQR